MPEINNDQRAARAALTLEYYDRAVCCNAHNAQSIEEQIADLLADVRHLAHREAIDFDACDRTSALHFDAECDSNTQGGCEACAAESRDESFDLQSVDSGFLCDAHASERDGAGGES